MFKTSLAWAPLAALLFALACTPRAAEKTTTSPVKPIPPTHWDTLGKPVIGAEADEPDTSDLSLDEDWLRILNGEAEEDTPEERSDTLPIYHPSATKTHNLVHTRVELSFDWDKRRVNGKAVLTLHPWFFPTDQVTLDAKNFDIHYVGLEGKKDTLKYDYNNEQLSVYLGRTLARKDTFRVVVHYTAKPEERDSFGGSAAITSDKGLYFINPDGSDPNKPRQIWTQGETENTSRWVPTIDKPNQRCTQEMFLTVDDRYKTLSNGLLKSSKKNADGTRTDYWVMDKTHAPYLFMVAVGEYAVVKDRWRNIPVEYYVEPPFEAVARDIFPYTPEMLEFFSNKLRYPYPWPKYAQVVVRDFVSGAMENTTAVVFGEFVQKNRRALMDQHKENERIVAHEMFHHWFGNLVTTESWANLTLNEGFANYAEYLWFEHKYGREEADFHYHNERQGYFSSAQDGGHPLIYFGYDSREDMFDAHSYNKGGAVLHMLRHYLGDEAFFASLNYYLTKNAYSDVEAHELRLAFEEVTGQDLNWFFNQWFFSAGHPRLDIQYAWNDTTRQASVTITQMQEAQNGVPYVFDLPLYVDIYNHDGRAKRHAIRVSKRSQTFTFDLPQRPALINVDAEKVLLAEKNDAHTPEEWLFMYRKAPLWQDRLEALQGLLSAEEPGPATILEEALRDRHWVLRLSALISADVEDLNIRSIVAQMADSDPSSIVRAQAIESLGALEDKQYQPLFERALNPEVSYGVLNAALKALAKVDLATALQAARAYQNERDENLANAIAGLYAQAPDTAYANWFLSAARWVDNTAALSFFEHHAQYLTRLNQAAITRPAVELFYTTATSSGSLWRRFSATRALHDLRAFSRSNQHQEEAEKLSRMIEDIRTKEKDELLRSYYNMFD